MKGTGVMRSLIRWLGSLTIAVPLLIVIAAVLAWGTIYETRFGTASVQRFVYHSWWFQGLLAFLALNLAVAALERYPWQRRHAPFVLAHLGIILVLLGGIIGGRFGIEGQLIIPEGSAERTLQLPGNVLVVHQPNPGVHQAFPTNFETQAWVHEPRTTFPITLDGRSIQLTVDRYYPDAVTDETITDDGAEENPALHLVVRDRDQQDALWLLAREPERFGSRWGEAHLLFLEPSTPAQLDQLLHPSTETPHPRGVVTLRFEGMARAVELPVPEELNQTMEIPDTPYRITFKDYFPDFAITEQGLKSRSNQPN
ncbi:MAG: cytochrome c biogenesis protein ResB, partial [Candidatus Omnitrophica bacterium]|nr:cytochrome c biogenesis protein ResB [Candidatus Omnitrophota bacterium]